MENVCTKPEGLKPLRNRNNADIMAVLKKACTIKAQLEEMDTANSAVKRLSGCKEGKTPYRVRIAVMNGMRKNLKGLMMDFLELRQRMIIKLKGKVGRRYYTVTGENPGEEVIENVIYDGNKF